MKKQKYYTVWNGLTPGVYSSWKDCLLQTKGVKDAKFKSFDSLAEAQQAFAASYTDYISKPKSSMPHNTPSSEREYSKEVLLNSLAVDAACSGNPGKMEYRGVHVASGQEVFHFGPVYGTNNIGEFLAIVHGLALMKQKKLNLPIYSDSVNAIKWIKAKKCRTLLAKTSKTEELFKLIGRAETWLHTNTYSTKIIKWETSKWGEIPADFGRK
jgi:ribonuclease HI